MEEWKTGNKNSEMKKQERNIESGKWKTQDGKRLTLGNEMQIENIKHGKNKIGT